MPAALTETTAAAAKGAWASPGHELTVVNAYDAFGEPREGLRKDFGFSTVIRFGGHTILFDSGTRAEIFAANLASLGVTPAEIDFAIASHSHHDHIAGFDYLIEQNPKVKLFLPKDFHVGAPVTLPLGGREPDVAQTLPRTQCYFDCASASPAALIASTGRFWKGDVTYVAETLRIAEGVTLVPTTSELMGTFVKYPPFEKEPRLIGMPELSLALSTSKGTVLIVGCSHSSVEAIVKTTRATIDAPIHLLLGGYHLLPYDREYLVGLAGRLKEDHQVKTVAPCHCSGHLAFSVFQDAYGDSYRPFGLGSKIAW